MTDTSAAGIGATREDRSERLRRLVAVAADRFSLCDNALARDLTRRLAAAKCPDALRPPVEVPPCMALPALCADDTDSLTGCLRDCLGDLCWRPPGFGRLPVAVSSRMAVAELLGPDGMIPDHKVRVGLLLQLENVHYPSHRHAAEELYFVIAGSASWAVDDGAYVDRGAGSFVHHLPWQPHAMKTGPSAMLTMWGWAGDIGASTYAV